MQRFFFTNLTPSHSLSIHDEWFVHQISRVLRSRLGDEITLFNGDWYDYRYRIASIEKKNITLELVSSEKNQAEPSLFIHLYQALPNKYEKIEYIIQKGVEIGISQFTFFFSERSQKLVISNKKIERFQEITREALEQCGGNSMPTITFLEKGGIPRSEWNSFVLHTKSADSFPLNSLANEGKAECSLNCYIWPEGGWSDQEMKTFADMRIKSIHLGNRILRTETAGSAVAFFLLQSGGFLTQDQK